MYKRQLIVTIGDDPWNTVNIVTVYEIYHRLKNQLKTPLYCMQPYELPQSYNVNSIHI